MPCRGETNLSKYNNVPQRFGDLRFDSKAEASRAAELRWLEWDGQISHLELRKKELRYDLTVNGIKIATYVADFRYYDQKHARWIVEDVKGHRTREYRIKKLLMKAIHGIDILETGKTKKSNQRRVSKVHSRPPLSRGGK